MDTLRPHVWVSTLLIMCLMLSAVFTNYRTLTRGMWVINYALHQTVQLLEVSWNDFLVTETPWQGEPAIPTRRVRRTSRS